MLVGLSDKVASYFVFANPEMQLFLIIYLITFDFAVWEITLKAKMF